MNEKRKSKLALSHHTGIFLILFYFSLSSFLNIPTPYYFFLHNRKKKKERKKS